MNKLPTTQQNSCAGRFYARLYAPKRKSPPTPVRSWSFPTVSTPSVKFRCYNSEKVHQQDRYAPDPLQPSNPHPPKQCFALAALERERTKGTESHPRSTNGRLYTKGIHCAPDPFRLWSPHPPESASLWRQPPQRGPRAGLASPRRGPRPAQ
jgi:hypothetical protein